MDYCYLPVTLCAGEVILAAVCESVCGSYVCMNDVFCLFASKPPGMVESMESHTLFSSVTS